MIVNHQIIKKKKKIKKITKARKKIKKNQMVEEIYKDISKLGIKKEEKARRKNCSPLNFVFFVIQF